MSKKVSVALEVPLSVYMDAKTIYINTDIFREIKNNNFKIVKTEN